MSERESNEFQDPYRELPLELFEQAKALATIDELKEQQAALQEHADKLAAQLQAVFVEEVDSIVSNEKKLSHDEFLKAYQRSLNIIDQASPYAQEFRTMLEKRTLLTPGTPFMTRQGDVVTIAEPQEPDKNDGIRPSLKFEGKPSYLHPRIEMFWIVRLAETGESYPIDRHTIVGAESITKQLDTQFRRFRPSRYQPYLSELITGIESYEKIGNEAKAKDLREKVLGIIHTFLDSIYSDFNDESTKHEIGAHLEALVKLDPQAYDDFLELTKQHAVGAQASRRDTVLRTVDFHANYIAEQRAISLGLGEYMPPSTEEVATLYTEFVREGVALLETADHATYSH
jgi:hypothetical protein